MTTVAAAYGWDSGAKESEDATEGLIGTASFSTAQARTGAYSLRCNPASGASGYWATGGSGGYCSFGLYIATLPSVSRMIMGIVSPGSVNVLLNSSGTLTVRNESTTIVTSTTALSTGAWYWISVRATTGTTVEWLKINDVAEGGTATSTVTAIQQIGCGGTEASAIDIYLDDVIFADTFLSPSKVQYAFPTGEGTDATWRLGDGTAFGNGWAAIDNVPPAGAASASETASTNIESASSTGTATYNGNPSSYTDLGITASDTILGVRATIQHGEDISTGAKTGTIELSSNPVTSSTAFTFGITASAAHGAYNSGNWWTAHSPWSLNPSVTLGNAANIKIVKTDTTTRVACVDQMYLKVVWTPAVATRVPHFSPYPQLLAH